MKGLLIFPMGIPFPRKSPYSLPSTNEIRDRIRPLLMRATAGRSNIMSIDNCAVRYQGLLNMIEAGHPDFCEKKTARVLYEICYTVGNLSIAENDALGRSFLEEGDFWGRICSFANCRCGLCL